MTTLLNKGLVLADTVLYFIIILRIQSDFFSNIKPSPTLMNAIFIFRCDLFYNTLLYISTDANKLQSPGVSSWRTPFKLNRYRRPRLILPFCLLNHSLAKINSSIINGQRLREPSKLARRELSQRQKKCQTRYIYNVPQ